ncbi:ribonuclease HIII [Vagococcus carniphilus]|uniref:ribonuclease HIII n=1 Tax=Vagococcus carniphilus TaxID=218144 RepID=UPI00288C8969|nr:ribonuclease HIII [Vagococcus carniphilus]MDT2848816.1 ribonuclease HIII [Vagococcus carniphilus]MDT2865849.1 ribonuclease HIII [Vagococcus carniphilus]
MSQSITLKCHKDVITKMNTTYRQSLTKVPPYAVFSAKLPGVTVTAYNSGKVLFQGVNAEKEASKWGEPETSKKGVKNTTTSKDDSLPSGFSNWSVVGSDEVGNGSYLGPVVVCATYAKKEQLPLLKELGVKDSKMLTDPMIKKIAKDLKLVIPFRQLIVTPKKYNEIQPNYNVNRMKVALHNQAIHLLLNDLLPEKPEGILIDQFTTEKNYRSYLKQEPNQVTSNLYFKTKGEQYHLSVAAASIICRATFLEELDKASKELGITVPSGAGTKSDQAAAKILKKGGLPLLEKYAKLHFANTEKAQKIAFR